MNKKISKNDIEALCRLAWKDATNTKMAIDIMLYWLENKYLDTVLIIVKKSQRRVGINITAC